MINQIGNDTQLKVNTEIKGNKIEDDIIETIAENLKIKVKKIIAYYTKLINERKVDFEIYQKYCKEMSICSMLTMLEIKLFLEFIRPKENFFEDEEIHFLKLNLQEQNKYDYSYINCNKDNILINKENQILENYKIDFMKMEIDLKTIISTLLKKIDINIEDMDSFDFITNNNLKNYYSGDLEKYFFKIFENGVLCFSKKDFKTALDEFTLSKYLSEYIIFIGLITSFKKETILYTEMLSLYKSESSSSINCTTITSFIGGIIKTFKSQKIIEEDQNSSASISTDAKESSSNETTENVYEMLIGFYPNILSLLKESEEKIKKANSSYENIIKEVI